MTLSSFVSQVTLSRVPSSDLFFQAQMVLQSTKFASLHRTPLTINRLPANESIYLAGKNLGFVVWYTEVEENCQ